jgi:hypothetical protein
MGVSDKVYDHVSSSKLRTEPEYKNANELFENVAKFKYVGTTQIRMPFMMRSRED